MKALILNAGLGSRMGDITKDKPKCMTKIYNDETILKRQLRLLNKYNVKDIIMTTGYKEDILVSYIKNDINDITKDMNIVFSYNEKYDITNYIYSIYLARNDLNDDILLMHGDLVFDEEVLKKILSVNKTSMVISTTKEIPEKDFKAVVINGKVVKVGVDYFNNAYYAEAMYYLKKDDFYIWLNKIIEFCENGNTKVYAENAFNELNGKINMYPLDIKDLLCGEIDNKDDLEKIMKEV